MSLRDTRDIGTAKIVMLGGGGGGSYSAGSGISISNSVITNIRKGALTGVVDSVSSNIAHTQIDNALTTTTAGALVVLKAEASGTSIDTVRVQYGAQASESNDFRLRDTSGNYTTIDIASGDTIIMMLNATGYQMIVLSILGASTGGGYAGLGIGKKTGVTSNVIDTDIDLHRAPIVGDRLLVYFDEKVTNPTGLITYNNGVAVTSNLENVTPLYINAGWNILEFKNDGLLYNNVWVRKLNVPLPISTLSGLTDTAITTPSNGQLLTYDSETQKWKNQKYVEANMGFSDTELKKLKVGNVVYDTDGLRDYFVTDIENNNITISVLNSNQFVMENIAINTGAHSGSSSAWNLILDDGMYPVLVALKNADGTPFADDIHENELLLVYVDTAGNVARVLDIPVDNTEIKTVSGNPITLTDAVAGNAIEVSAEIVASQSGSGTPSPTNVRPISGFSSVTITREDAQGQTATVTVSLGQTVYGGTLDLTSGELTITHGYKDLGTLSWSKDTTTRPADGATIHAFYAGISEMKTVANTDIGNIMCSQYVADKVTSVDYGGYSDVKDGIIGGADTNHRIWVYDSRYNEYSTADFKTAMSGVQIVYELATPTTTTLTAEQLALVKGQNTLTCNSGNMEITYKASGLDALKERVDDLEDAVADLETDMASKAENSVVGTVENGTTASKAYAVGKHFIRNDKFCTAIAAIASGATLTQGTNYVEGTIAEALNGVGIPHISDMPSFTMSATDRFTRVAGGWISKGNKTYINILLKLAYAIPAYTQNPYAGEYDTRIPTTLPVPYAKMSNKLDVSWGQKNTYNSYPMIAEGVGHIAVNNDGNAYIAVGASVALNGTSNDIYCLIRGEYDNQ